MKKTKIKTIILTCLTFFVATGCSDNSTGSNTPENAIISGTVTFTGSWPENGIVAISLNTNWPPTGAPANSIQIESNDLINNTTYSYSFNPVAFGTYASLAVSWQNPDDLNPATNQHTLGAYGGEYPFFTNYGGVDPTSITVSEIEYELNSIDFDANLDYIN